MRSRSLQQAYTLVELMITLTIMSFLLLACAPFLTEWIYSSQVKDAQSKLLAGYGLAKALAPGRVRPSMLRAFWAIFKLCV
jgi:prepilin-type N-terminal cleavage/methylation domain-containing protein